MSEVAADLIGAWPVPHAAAAVVNAQGELVASFGDPDRRFMLASVTKPIAAVATLLAVEEGAFSLDDPAGPPGSTVRHLLAHASGLALDPDTVAAKPGQLRVYSNVGFQVLARFVAEHTGMPFTEYVRLGVFEPLGMAGSTIEGPSGAPGDSAYSTVGDLARFAGDLLRPTLLHMSTWEQASQPVFGGLRGVLPGFGRQDPNLWGLGVEVRGEKSPHWTGQHNSPQTYGHFGQSGTFIWVDPAVRLACVALTDRAFGDWSKQCWPGFSDAVLAEYG